MKKLSFLFAALVAGAFGLSANAEVLVYEGFDATEYGLNATSHDTATKALKDPRTSIGVSTGAWSGMGGSQVKVFGTDYGLDFPQDMKDVNFTARGGSIGFNFKENNSSQLRAMNHALAKDVLKVSSGKLYFRELLLIDANSAARLSKKDTLTTGDGSHYGFGFTVVPSGNDYNLLLNGKSSMAFAFWKNKSDQIVLSFTVTDKDGVRTVTDLVTSVTFDETYVCYAEIDVNASDGKEVIRANAVASSNYSTVVKWVSAGEADFITETAYPNCMAVAGPYQAKNGIFRADEIIVATELNEVIAANANAPVLAGATLLWDDANNVCLVTATMKKNSASFVASAKTSEGDDLPVVSAASSVIGPDESDTVSLGGLVADTTYRVTAIAGEGDLSDSKVAGSLYSGTLALAKMQDANEYGCVPGKDSVSRANADPYPLVVNYAFSSTATGAEEGKTWEIPLGSVTIPADEASAVIELVPRVDMTVAEDIIVTLAITAGAYPSVAQTVDLTLKNLVTRPEYNTWVAPEADSAAKDENWSYGHAPTADEDILFDGYISSANCSWGADAAHTVKSWTQNNGYSGIIDLQTVYPGKGDFPVLTVTGAMTVDSGTITHPISRQTWDNISDYLEDLKANETYRIRIDAGSFTVGSAGRIDATNKGYYQANSGSVTTPKPAHGGWLEGSKPYDDVKEPIHIGMGSKPASGTYTIGIGGGAIYIVSTGDAVVNGTICADTRNDCWNSGLTLRGGAAAGSVYLKANSVTGAGTISASAGWTDEQNNKGCGGRVAVVSTSTMPVDYTSLKLKATVEPFKSNGTSECDTHGSAGTVYTKDATQTYGTLLIDNVANMPAQAFTRPATIPCNDEGDWTFDRIGLGRRAILSVPEGSSLALANGLSGVFAIEGSETSLYGVLRYDGGTLDLGSAETQTMSGKWTFAPRKPYAFSGNLALVNGARLGLQDLPQIYDQTADLPEYGICDATIAGDLSIDTSSTITVRGGGLRKEGNTENNGFKGVFPGATHGGRSSGNAWIDKEGLGRFSVSYDSVFAPHLPGCSVPHPNGQSCASSGGVLKLVIGGKLTNEGDICANGNDDGTTANSNSAGGTGGAIDITAGSIEGAGKIRADGGFISNWRGTGGRVAVKLTEKGADFSAYTGEISASGRTQANAKAPERDGSAGTVYLQAGDESDKHGTMRIWMTSANRSALNANTTDIVSTGLAGSDVATGDLTADYKSVKLEVADYGRALVNVDDLKLSSVALTTADAVLDLNGKTLTVNTARLGGAKLKPGTYAADDAALGDFVTDSVGGGSLVVKGTGMMLLIR